MNSRRIYNPVQKDYVTFLQSTLENGGQQTHCLMEVAPGGKVLLHYHQTYSESFIVRTGVLQVRIGNRELILHEGERATVPPGTLHRWANPGSQTAVADVIVEPGHLGFERTLQAAYGLARDGKARADGAPKSLFYLALLGEMSEIKLTGLSGRLGGLFRLLAWVARRLGKHQALEKYYLDFQPEGPPIHSSVKSIGAYQRK